MLTQLYIENVAVINKASIPLVQGLNVFTGETGAGKTVLISAINAVLGGRVSKDIIRHGESKAIITAVFSDILPWAQDKITELGFGVEDGELLLSRELLADGKGSCRVNGRPCTASILKQIANCLLDIHGQNDSRFILSTTGQIEFIDSFGDIAGDIADYKKDYNELTQLNQQLEDLEQDDSYRLQKIDMLKFQLEEIEQAELNEEEDEELAGRKEIIKNAENITSALATIYNALHGGDDQVGVLSGVEDIEDGLYVAGKYVPDMEYYANKIVDIRCELQELASSAGDILEDYSFNPGELDVIESRLAQIDGLKKKYGSTVGEILEHYENIENELDELLHSDKKLEKLQKQQAAALKSATAKAKKITDKRKKCGKEFVSRIQEELLFLDMPNIKMEVVHSTQSLGSNGQDSMELYISTNVGEEPKPMAKIASGGELSRVMLAIKTVLAEKDDMGTVIFDEIDTGVSGSAAHKIGQKLWQAATNRQILCVTHLAQVAAFGDNHIKILKEIKGNKTFTSLDTLDKEQRIRELARISVGDDITESALKSAEEMLSKSERL